MLPAYVIPFVVRHDGSIFCQSRGWIENSILADGFDQRVEGLSIFFTKSSGTFPPIRRYNQHVHFTSNTTLSMNQWIKKHIRHLEYSNHCEAWVSSGPFKSFRRSSATSNLIANVSCKDSWSMTYQYHDSLTMAPSCFMSSCKFDIPVFYFAHVWFKFNFLSETENMNQKHAMVFTQKSHVTPCDAMWRRDWVSQTTIARRRPLGPSNHFFPS